jgi:hypothetical protein
MNSILLSAIFATALLADPAGLAEQRAAREGDFVADIEKLAADATAKGLEEQAKIARDWVKPRNPLLLYSPKLPLAIRPAALPAGTPAPVVEWDRQFWMLRSAFAEDLFALARQAIKDKKASLAYELVLACARQNPDHADARRLLGYKQYLDQWRTDFEIKQLKENKVWTEQFGWIRKDHVARYTQGERFTDGKWVSANEDAQLHSDIADGWQIETDHYLVTTNKGLAEGVLLGQQLEELYRVWQHTFVKFYATSGDLTNLFAGRAGTARKPVRHKVLYFRSKAEYLRHLQHSVPNDLSITSGFYNGDQQTAYFFAGPESDPSTVVHEATHQLFSETNPEVQRKSSQNLFWLRKKHNFWLVEGIACYMESLTERDGQLALGGGTDARMQGALVRLFRDNYYVPLSELVGLNMENLQGRKDIAQVYGQSAAVVSFLMHYDNGRYRDELTDYLLAVYMGRDAADSLAKLTGVKLEELDKQFRDYMQETLKRSVPAGTPAP